MTPPNEPTDRPRSTIEVKEITTQIKAQADQRNLSLDDVDALLRHYHSQALDASTMVELGLEAVAASFPEGGWLAEDRGRASGKR